jgi:addiction module HigA family antidote
MPMKNPPHPAQSVRYDCLEPLGLFPFQAAKVLGVPLKALNKLLYEDCGISPDMAIRLDNAFGGTAEAWLALQTAYDLAQTRKKEHSITVSPYVGKGAVRLPMLAEVEDALTLQNKD